MRDQLIDFLKREIVGPDPSENQENGEEILEISPRERYASGVLFPQNATFSSLENEEIEDDQLDLFQTEKRGDKELETSHYNIGNGNEEETDLNEEPDTVNLANTYLQSALGFSCKLETPASIKINIRAAYYLIEKPDSQKATYPKQCYRRIPIEEEILINADELPQSPKEPPYKYAIQNTDLELNILRRSGGITQQDNNYFSFTLLNKKNKKQGIKTEDCYFQPSLKVKSLDNKNIFKPIQRYRPKKHLHPDEESLDFVYRHKKMYAIGHGCAVKWDVSDGNACTGIWTEIVPVVEVKPIIPKSFEDIFLEMKILSDAESGTALDELKDLVKKYQTWLSKRIKEKENLQQWSNVADRHIKNCKKTINRIQKGISLLETDTICRQAFAWMNKAMLLQQLHYRMSDRAWKKRSDNNWYIDGELKWPDLNDESTWPGYVPDESSSRYGKWYPFQIAFILMNLNAFVKPENDERKIIDLIWFPTGGGKTEAYLGLSAFAIFYKRLLNQEDTGTTVIMRYTLRLLTAQQFQRAASLICACEYIRRRKESQLGKVPISLGLWVGNHATPNSRKDSRAKLIKLENKKTEKNSFVLLKCPWCGTQMGLVKDGRKQRVKGYRQESATKPFIFQCGEKECEFSKIFQPLPLFIVDEDLYETPPSVLIGTVDKFAMLVWKPEAKSFFGFNQGKRLSPPSLIIQDELHLISGALGSIVGIYETMIHELCVIKNDEKVIMPKIIASTATISRAQEQLQALYARKAEEINLFPAQGFDIKDSFFGWIDDDKPGRVYVGIHPAGLISKITAQVRVEGALLQGTLESKVQSEFERDPYYTLLSYFCSLRELGTAATLLYSYVPDYIKRIFIRRQKRNVGEGKMRYLNRILELTSRIPGTDIPNRLRDLEACISDQNNKAVDVCLATNMISVGLDIQRLGLMLVNGQPKMVSEYIQATSRVGRSFIKPGLIVVLYNPFRSRDRSFYEQFYQVHNTLYKSVEPSSVTPFSRPVREKALHAVLVGLVRYLGSSENEENPNPLPDDQLIARIRKTLLERVRFVSREEFKDAKEMLDNKLDHWNRLQPPLYGHPVIKESDEEVLLTPANQYIESAIEGRSWPTMTSMREVANACELFVLVDSYQKYEG
ncbi:hypothetical protein GF406_00370 [candidate division KSB1 bacterium]|nr:hypothetical protein [candidate division KSB1 bacterium]